MEFIADSSCFPFIFICWQQTQKIKIRLSRHTTALIQILRTTLLALGYIITHRWCMHTDGGHAQKEEEDKPVMENNTTTNYRELVSQLFVICWFVKRASLKASRQQTNKSFGGKNNRQRWTHSWQEFSSSSIWRCRTGFIFLSPKVPRRFFSQIIKCDNNLLVHLDNFFSLPTSSGCAAASKEINHHQSGFMMTFFLSPLLGEPDLAPPPLSDCPIRHLMMADIYALARWQLMVIRASTLES